MVTAKLGDRVSAGDPLASVYASDDSTLEVGMRVLRTAIRVGPGEAQPVPLISHRVTKEGTETIGTS